MEDGHEAKARRGHPDREARKSDVEKGPGVGAAYVPWDSADLEVCVQPQNLWLAMVNIWTSFSLPGSLHM